ncbi:hypothetical protein CAMRE0001_3006 [Campylobacter rectus RM3267]|uniref:Uncharacterized protein n=1 Tax=Campylobacter rectus RM3267 TaxID=553218 RepID=B9D537_CAMRE|nr:hypothetical protein CAMRE0001_3006 [Campylobacter rectus RM3267]
MSCALNLVVKFDLERVKFELILKRANLDRENLIKSNLKRQGGKSFKDASNSSEI